MISLTIFVALSLTLVASVFAAPQGSSTSVPPAEPTKPNVYTLTAFAPGNLKFHGLKVNNLNLFQEKVGQYCPTPPVTTCPNGTDQVFIGTLTPSVLVPGGQDLYVTADGRLSITVQHSHSIPPDAYWNYYGWTWTAITRPPPHSGHPPSLTSRCPRADPLYNCTVPGGYYTFKAPDDSSPDGGGVLACPYPQNPGGPPIEQYALWARTPRFVERPECVELKGLGTHEYSGVMPPVWAY